MTPRDAGGRLGVLLVTEALEGGVLRHMDHLVRHLPHDRFDVQMAVSAERAPGAREHVERWREAGRVVHAVPMRKRPSPLRDLTAFGRLLALCRRGRYDIVHTHSAKGGFLGRLAGRMAGAVTVHTPHVFPFDRGVSEAAEAFYLGLERTAARWTDHLVLLSRYQVNTVLRRRLLPPERVTVIPNGVDPAGTARPDAPSARRTLGLPDDVPVVLAMGRLCRQKGLDVLVDAAARAVRQGGPAFRLLIVGDGPSRRMLEAKVQEGGLGGVVSLPGVTADPWLYYAACDLVAMPSWFEGMPYVLLEARAMGRPVAVSLCSGMEEFVTHGRDGFLLPPGNADAWARVLLRACRDRRELVAVGQWGRERLRPEWTARASVERLAALYARLAGGYKDGAQPEECQPGSD